MRNQSFIMLGFMAVALFTSTTAQEINKSKTEPSPPSAREKTVINIWPGVAPGSEQWKQPETFIGSVGSRRIMNVSVPKVPIVRIGRDGVERWITGHAADRYLGVGVRHLKAHDSGD